MSAAGEKASRDLARATFHKVMGRDPSGDEELDAFLKIKSQPATREAVAKLARDAFSLAHKRDATMRDVKAFNGFVAAAEVSVIGDELERTRVVAAIVRGANSGR